MGFQSKTALSLIDMIFFLFISPSSCSFWMNLRPVWIRKVHVLSWLSFAILQITAWLFCARMWHFSFEHNHFLEIYFRIHQPSAELFSVSST